ncbi:MAG: hypothetical protein M3O70_12220 [Actinomycetota bacterium]|nr:hypothetical protein [Actinomycetota bacterium]
MILLAGEIVFPGEVTRWQGENGLRIWVDGWHRPDERAEVIARYKIQILLGLLRAWRADAGKLKQERWGGLGQGSRRDSAGNQWVPVGPAVAYLAGHDELIRLAEAVASAIGKRESLCNALWLNGRADRTAADYYMVHEYAETEFGGKKRVRDRLDISVNDQNRLTRSANKLSPLEGGRHARHGAAPWSLDECREFIAQLLRQWIQHYGPNHG